ncbi:MAG: flagellar export protein FliJ [Thermotogaceae bacterium]|nr:flagellar export protein FliJ [Thermotogaceae bacterium]
MRFDFRLEKLLKLKASQLQQVKLELASVRYKIAEISSQIETMRQMIEDLWVAFQNTVQKGMSGKDMFLWRLHIDAKVNDLNSKQEELQQMLREEERLRQEYLETRKDLKIIENLKQRQLQRFQVELHRKNKLYLDEIAIRKYIRDKEVE